ncbi:hypothetical protein MAR_023899 [Mya arenaria]|uniref:Death domain-containing protein n=1 Tax=Mya arenaria TaxID=6604 RepID=A0ABY7DP99_MYAAR|nr:hypothetical protein MAR_023899 [Mya arenaria]
MAQHSTDTSSDEAQSARRDMNDSYYPSDILIPHTDIHRHAASILHPQSLYNEDFWTAPPTYYRSRLCSHTLDSIPMSEYPVIDMRNSRDFTRSKDHIQLKTNLSQTLIKKAVCERYHVTENFVEIVEYETKVESSPRKTLIIIVPKSTAGFCGLVLETYEDKDQRVPRIMCAHLPLGMVIHDLKRELKVFLNWKNLAICKDSKVLSDNSPLQEFQLEKLERLQVYQFDHQVIDFVYQSGQHCHYRYRVNVNLTKSVGQVKDRLRRQVGDELKKLQATDKMFLHFTVQEKLVEDDLCMGRVVERFGRDDHVGLHLSSENAISVTLKFNKPLKMKQRMLICKMVCSSAQLRGEIGKLVDHDQKSVKLTLNSKLMEECPDIGKKYGTEWQSGCTVSVGIKKHKTLRIKHPEDGRELVLKMYMLEPVSELKRKVSEAWNLNILNMSLICRGQRMLGSKLLMFYPIKNNMEIQLQLFPHRISFHVRIAFKKRWVKVVVDDSSVSTVDDLLRFCAHKYEYARKCSRAIFNGCCLHKNSSLQEENLKTNDQVVIVHFDQKIESNGELILIFMGREDGHTIMRCGSVVAGLLLHAAKKTKLQEPEHLDNGALPGDIHIVPEALPDDASKQLEVKETTLEQIEHEYRQLQEQAYKGLFNWTREKGKKATKNALIEALMKVHLTSVAEAINGHTTV